MKNLLIGLTLIGSISSLATVTDLSKGQEVLLNNDLVTELEQEIESLGQVPGTFKKRSSRFSLLPDPDPTQVVETILIDNDKSIVDNVDWVDLNRFWDAIGERITMNNNKLIRLNYIEILEHQLAILKFLPEDEVEREIILLEREINSLGQVPGTFMDRSSRRSLLPDPGPVQVVESILIDNDKSIVDSVDWVDLNSFWDASAERITSIDKQTTNLNYIEVLKLQLSRLEQEAESKDEI